MKKALVFDIDGTLLNSEKKLLPENIQILKKLFYEHGVKVILASARMPRSLFNIANLLGVECLCVSYNGGLGFSSNLPTRATLVDFPMHQTDLQLAYFLAIEHDVHISVFTLNSWIAFGDDDWLKREITGNAFSPDLVGGKEVEHSIRNEKCYKLMVRGKPNKIRPLWQIFKKQPFCSIKINSDRPTIIEVTSGDTSKSSAILKIILNIGISKQDIFVFGDGDNDLDMFLEFPFSVAMGNAVPVLSKHALFNIDNNNQPSIAHFLEEKMLNSIS